MAKTKAVAETSEKAARKPAAAKRPAPEVAKPAGPQHLARAPLPAAAGAVSGDGSAAAGAPGRARTMGALQRTLGNARLARMAAPAAVAAGGTGGGVGGGRPIQAKLAVGPADDPFESEADAAASRIAAGRPVERISRLPAAGAARRTCAACEEEQAQRQPERQPRDGTPEDEKKRTAPVQTQAAGTAAGEPGLDTEGAERAMARSGPGSPLPPSMQTTMEDGFGADFSAVRVHTGPEADEASRAVNARAFTRGPDIYLARTESPTDPRLMGHELTHTVQQGAAAPRDRATMGLPASRVAATTPDPETVRRQTAGGGGGGGTTAATPLTAPPPAVGGGGDLTQIDWSIRIAQPTVGEVGSLLPPRLEHERRVQIRTDSGLEVELMLRAATEFPNGYDTSRDPNAALGDPGLSSMGYTIRGHLADGTPVAVMGQIRAEDVSMADMAGQAPRFAHFGLRPEEQRQAVLDAIREAVTEPVYRQSEERARQQRRVEYPTQEEFSQMSREERRALARDKFWEEFSWWNVLMGALFVLAALVLALVAIVALAEGAIVLGVLALIAALGLAIYGLYEATVSMIHNVGQRWEEGQYAAAVLEIIKWAATVVAIILGAIILVVLAIAAFIGTEVAIAGLAIAAVIALVIAVVAGVILVFIDLDRASESTNVEDFRESVQRAAREAEEVVTTIITIILGFIFESLGRRFARSGRGDGETPPEPSAEPGERPLGPVEGEQPIIIDPVRLGGNAEPMPGNRIRLFRGQESVEAEVLSRTPAAEGEVMRVRTPTGEGDIFVRRNPDGSYHWRGLTPEEAALLAQLQPGIRGTRSQPAVQTEPPRLPTGEIDYAAWQQRLQQKGVRGDLQRRIDAARAGDASSRAELEAAERYADAGYDVELIRPPAETPLSEGGPVRGVSSGDMIVRPRRGGRAIRVEVKSREPGQPISRNNLNSRATEANNQIRESPEGRGDIIIDATEAGPGGLDQVAIEQFMRGKMTGNRFAPDARLSNVEYFEIRYPDGGQVKRTYIYRNSNGDAIGPITEVLE